MAALTRELTSPSAPRPLESGIVPCPDIRPDLLSYRLLSPRNPGPADIPLLGEAYRCWRSVWQQTLQELDHLDTVPSDDFSRQDEIGALFHEWECLGLTSYRWLDLSNPIDRDDSYFHIWSEEARAAAAMGGPRVCICGNLTVAAPWRRAKGVPVKEVLLSLAVERFLESPADALLGTPRNDRGMNALGYRLGFQPLSRGVIHHGVEVDLVAFFRASCTRAPSEPSVEAAVQALRPRLGEGA